MRLSIIVPFYNEAVNVIKIQQEFLPVVMNVVNSLNYQSNSTCQIELVFVDDGSTDGSLTQFTKVLENIHQPGLSTRFVQHATNMGLGAALRTGFISSTGDLLITTDVDGTYKFDEILNLLAYLKPDVDIVTASPYHPEGQVVGVPAHRLLLSRGSSLIYRILVKWDIHTYTSLFRAYRRRVIDAIPFESNGFLAGTELMVKAMLAGYRVVEFPTILHRRTYGISKAKLFRTTIAHLKFQGWVLRHRLGLFSRKS